MADGGGMGGSRPGRWHRLLPAVSGLVLFLLTLAAGGMVEVMDRASHLDALRAETTRDLSVIRSRLDAALNANLMVGSTLAARIAQDPGTDATVFSALAAPLISPRLQVRGFALLDGQTVRFSQPALGNAGDLARRADQAAMARLAEQRGQPVVAGPLDGPGASRVVLAWIPVPGQASALIRLTLDLDGLLAKAGMAGALPVQVAVRNQPAASGGAWSDNRPVFGDQGVFDRDPVLISADPPAVAWQLAAMPQNGWPRFADRAWTIRGITVFVGLILGGLAFGVVGVVGGRWSGGWDGAGSGYDAMTGLPNRALFLKSAREAMNEAQRRGRSAAIMLIGIDRFGTLAAVQGPGTLAVVVRTVGRGCASGLRPDDMLGYLGDGVFAALLLGIGGDAAMIAAERVRRAVGSCEVDGVGQGGGGPLMLSVSIGCALAEDQDFEPLNALGRAERRLREALACGPGQIVC